MKRQTTADTTTPEWDVEQERAEGDSWVASFDSETVSPARPASAHPKRSSLQIPLVVVGVCGTLLAAGWFFWQTWTATPAATAASLTTVAPSGTADFRSVPDGATITI